MGDKVYKVVPDPEWLKRQIAKAQEEYNRLIDAQILLLIMKGFSASQIHVRHNVAQYTGTGANFSADVWAEGPPANLGKRHATT